MVNFVKVVNHKFGSFHCSLYCMSLLVRDEVYTVCKIWEKFLSLCGKILHRWKTMDLRGQEYIQGAMTLAFQITQKRTSTGKTYKHRFMQMLTEEIQILVLNGVFASKLTNYSLSLLEYELCVFGKTKNWILQIAKTSFQLFEFITQFKSYNCWNVKTENWQWHRQN